MKKFLLAVAMAGGAAFAFRRLASKARNVRDHCREMMAGRQESTSTLSSGCGA